MREGESMDRRESDRGKTVQDIIDQDKEIDEKIAKLEEMIVNKRRKKTMFDELELGREDREEELINPPENIDELDDEEVARLFATMGHYPEDWSDWVEDSKDMVNSPSHYTGEVECIDGLEAALGEEGFQGYCRGNAMKYLWRCENKGKKLEDLQKAKWYLDKLIERMEDE